MKIDPKLTKEQEACVQGADQEKDRSEERVWM